MKYIHLQGLRAGGAGFLLLLGLAGGCGHDPATVAVPVPVVDAPAAARTRSRPARPQPHYEPRVDRVTYQPLDRPLAVMIENHPAARPQHGLGAADAVYEALSEGGITRFLAIFTSDNAPVIGPIRSARPVFIDLMQAFDPVYVHCGQSVSAGTLLAKRKLAHINELDIKPPFWRDARRRRPHNLYASTASLWRQAERMRLRVATAAWPLAGDDIPMDGKPARRITLAYRYGQRYAVRYDYEAGTERYRRLVNGAPHVDAGTGEQIAAGTVIVQQAPTRALGIETGELAVEVVGEGRCWVARNGRWRVGRWRKESPETTTTYEAEDGSSLHLAPGPAWIQVVPVGTTPKFSS